MRARGYTGFTTATAAHSIPFPAECYGESNYFFASPILHDYKQTQQTVKTATVFGFLMCLLGGIVFITCRIKISQYEIDVYTGVCSYYQPVNVPQEQNTHYSLCNLESGFKKKLEYWEKIFFSLLSKEGIVNRHSSGPDILC